MTMKASKSSMEPPAGATAATVGGATAVTDTPIGAAPTGHAMSLLEIVNNMKSSSRLDPAATEYIKNLDGIFNDAHAGIVGTPISTDKIEARAYKKNGTNYYIALLFAESHQTIDLIPPALRNVDVYRALKATDGNATLVQSIVVTKEDYPRFQQMAAFIINAFSTIVAGPAAEISVENLKGLKIVANTNIDMVRDYVRKISPHAVPARDDFGVVLCMETAAQNPINGLREVEQTPFMAITGYTRIMNPEATMTGVKFVPIPTITDIVSSIPNKNLLAMALPIAAEAFINIGLWSRPYQTFRAGCPNLGNLISDPATKKPLFTDTPETFANFIMTHMTNPFLAIDITEGRARCLGIDQMLYNRLAVINGVHRFLGIPSTQPVDQRELQEVQMFSNFTGTYIDKGTIKDTRCVDYLELAAKVQNHKEIKGFLLQSNQPQQCLEMVRSIHPDVTKSLYCTTTIIVDSVLVCVMSKGLHDAKININFDTPINGNINIAGLLNSQANQFGNLGAFAQGFGPRGFNPMTYGNIYADVI